MGGHKAKIHHVGWFMWIHQGIHPWVLRELIDLGAMPVSIIEKSWRKGEMPDWRKNVVSPIFKKGKKEDSENY